MSLNDFMESGENRYSGRKGKEQNNSRESFGVSSADSTRSSRHPVWSTEWHAKPLRTVISYLRNSRLKRPVTARSYAHVGRFPSSVLEPCQPIVWTRIHPVSLVCLNHMNMKDDPGSMMDPTTDLRAGWKIYWSKREKLVKLNEWIQLQQQ